MLTRGRIAVAMVIVAACAVGCASLASPAPTPTPTPDIQSMVEAAIDKAFAPTPTPDIQSMIEAAVNATLVTAATPTPTDTPRPTYTPKPKPTSSAKPTSRPTPTPRTIYVRRPTPAPTPQPTVIYYTVQPPRVTIVSATPTPESRRLKEVDCWPNCYTDQEPLLSPINWISSPKISEDGVIELVAVLDDDVDMGPLGTEDGGDFTVTDDANILYGTIVGPTEQGWEWIPRPGLWVAERFDYVANTLRVRVQIDSTAATHPGLRLCLWSGGVGGEKSLLDCVRVRQP